MSEKSVAQKLLFKEGYKVLLLNEPQGYKKTLGELPAKAAISKDAGGSFDLIQIFIGSQKELESGLKKIKGCLKPAGLLWLTYPKGTSKVKVDINRDTIRGYVEANGYKTVSLIAVDETWSALRVKAV